MVQDTIEVTKRRKKNKQKEEEQEGEEQVNSVNECY